MVLTAIRFFLSSLRSWAFAITNYDGPPPYCELLKSRMVCFCCLEYAKERTGSQIESYCRMACKREGV